MIEFENVSFKYPEDTGRERPSALRQISLKVEEGEFIALIGQNGSGKTTLLHLIKGLLHPTSGRILVQGMDTRETRNRRNLHSLVGMVFQNPEDQIVATRVREDVAFGLENLEVPTGEIQRRVDEVLTEMDLLAEKDREPHLLSAGQMQRLALAGVLATRPRILLFDEVTAMLDPAGRRMVMQQMEALNRAGLTILFITHSMEEAVHARRILVLHQGELARDGSPESLFLNGSGLTGLGLDAPDALKYSDQLNGLLPGFEGRFLNPADLLAHLTAPQSPLDADAFPQSIRPTISPDGALIDVQDLKHVYLLGTPLAHPALESVTFQVAAGTSHGLAGATGSGKSTLLQHLNGLLRPQSGKVQVGPFDMSEPELELRQVCQFAGLVIQNPEMQFFQSYVGDEIAFGPRQVGRKNLSRTVRAAMELVGLDFDSFVNRFVSTLSGGERRKVALASILALDPRILLLDEPFAGLDPASHLAISTIFQSIQSQGKEIVLCSHRMEDIIQLTQTMTILRKGTSLTTGTTREVFYHPELLIASGLLQPLAVQVASRLVALGWPLPPGILTMEESCAALTRVLQAEPL